MPVGECAGLFQVIVAEPAPLGAKLVTADLTLTSIREMPLVGLRVLLNPGFRLCPFRSPNAKR